LDEMGTGGAGVVSKCRHAGTGALAAVKRARDTSRRQRDWLRKEIAMLTRLGRARHPGVVSVTDSGMEAGVLWYAMAYVEGDDLAAYARGLWAAGGGQAAIAPGETVATTVTQTPGAAAPPPMPAPAPRQPSPPPPPASAPPAQRLGEALQITRDLALALAFIHGEGIVHADLKPRNVLLGAGRRPVIVDFGSALHAFTDGTSREVAQVEGLGHGTPGFMAPEQIRGEPLD